MATAGPGVVMNLFIVLGKLTLHLVLLEGTASVGPHLAPKKGFALRPKKFFLIFLKTNRKSKNFNKIKKINFTQ